MGSVVHQDFGKEQIESARKLARLLALVDERDVEMLRDPKKFFDMAAKEIVRLQGVVRAAREVLQPPVHWGFAGEVVLDLPERWTVHKDEWERMSKACAIIEAECR